VADHARAALERAGVDGVQVLHGDGYAGVPGAHFDRVIVTVGVAGLSPHWLTPLAPAGGLIVAPVEHAGTHPVLVVHGGAGGPATASVVCPAGFMSATGPLTAAHPGAHPAPAAAGTLTDFVAVTGPRWDPPLESPAYRDLWYAAGIWSRRATHAAVPGRDQSVLALLDQSRTGGAAIMSDGSVLAGGDRAAECAARAVEILDRWDEQRHPVMQAWRITLGLTGEPEAPIWVPDHWELP
jgi:protein-L-isoaspartate(D-aspartate) O-methyltransferase